MQNLLIATALNLVRALNWLSGAQVVGTRRSRLRQLLIPEPVMAETNCQQYLAALRTQAFRVFTAAISLPARRDPAC